MAPIGRAPASSSELITTASMSAIAAAVELDSTASATNVNTPISKGARRRSGKRVVNLGTVNRAHSRIAASGAATASSIAHPPPTLAPR